MKGRTLYEVDLNPGLEYLDSSVVLIVGLSARTITARPATWSGFSRTIAAVGSRPPIFGCRVIWEDESCD
jgi:hypothetical protein